MANFATRLRSLRLDRDLTQQQLADKVGMSPSVIAMYEAGKRTPSVEYLEALTDFFNVDVDYILGRSNYTYRLLSENQMKALDSGNYNIYGNHNANLAHLEDKQELLDMYNEIHENENLQILFDTAKDLTPQDLEKVLRYMKLVIDEEL